MKNLFISLAITSILIISISFRLLAQNAPLMITVEGGTFQMGSESGDPDEKPIHKVTVSTFRICEHELTVKEYKQYIDATNGKMPEPPDNEWYISHQDTKKFYTTAGKTWWGWKEDYPMHNVTWFDAVNYCNWLSTKEGLTKCYTKNADGGWDTDLSKNGYRLPTEAEWEYAARGGNKSTGKKFAGSNVADEVCWYDETTLLSGPKSIKTKKANELGIYDMSGNVWEWCSDYYTKGYYKNSPLKDPMNSVSQTYRVLRGGGWHYQGAYATVTSRDGPEAFYTNYMYGFRLAKSGSK